MDFVAVALVEICKAEKTLSIQTKPHTTAVASLPWGRVNTGFLLAGNSREQNAGFCSLSLFSCFEDDLLNVVALSLWVVVTRFEVEQKLLLSITCAITPEENEVLLLQEGKTSSSPLSFTVLLPLGCKGLPGLSWK